MSSKSSFRQRFVGVLVLAVLCLPLRITAQADVVARNSDWTPISQVFEGIPYVQVPAGCFQMGSTPAQVDALHRLHEQALDIEVNRELFANDQQPAHEQCFDPPFWIMQTEVTNEQFGDLPALEVCLSVSSEPEQARNCLTWFEARDFCQSIGGRLPTEREWEYAARGVESWLFPWGEAFVAEHAVYDAYDPEIDGDRAPVLGVAPVGSVPAGASWVGALDMAGNLWEWTSSHYQPYPYVADDGREADLSETSAVLLVLRGGSFANVASGINSVNRLDLSPDDSLPQVGFRCVRSG